MKCLVVDDSATLRRIVANALKSIGIPDVVEATDGNDALQKCGASVDLVITDWNMPVMGGLDLVRALRAAGRTLPILMVTTRSNRDDILQAVEAGVTGYLLKPFTPQSVREKLEEITGMGLEAEG
jgi:two-component system chemotaxis response regulator CheY